MPAWGRLRSARDEVAAATVAPLPVDVLDRLVSTALDAPPVADVIPLTSARRRRLSTPPPAWLLGAVAGIALLVGVAGVFRAVDLSGSRDDSSIALDGGDSASEESGEGAAARSVPTAGTAAAGGTFAPDPELVAGDLGDQEDPTTLAAAVGGLLLQPTTGAVSEFSARESAAAAPQADASTAANDSAAGGASAAAPPASTIPRDRAQCRAQGDTIGAGRFGALLSTATLRWKGEPAEVLVFELAQPPTPDSPASRQALVLARPGCRLLAEALL